MKIFDFLIAIAIGVLVGLPVFFLVNSYLLTKDRFKSDVEIVNPISSEFNTADSSSLFTDEDRVDYSSPVRLNTERNTRPFVNEQ